MSDSDLNQNTLLVELLKFINEHCVCATDIAIAVSGGVDSMALAHMLGCIAQNECLDMRLHVLSVDHDLRIDSKDDAAFVQSYFKGAPYKTTTMTVDWGGEKPDAGLMKAARDRRYAMMAEYCTLQDIQHLFLAHHADDQMETFLMRLVKGSGLDGLSAMTECQRHGSEELTDLWLMRPLLNVTHKALIEYCERNNVPWRDDPTNQNTAYTRNRLRASMDILKQEGLSTKRISATARRLARAKEALDFYKDEIKSKTQLEQSEQELRYDWTKLGEQPSEIILRVMLDAYSVLFPVRDYPPRMEQLEALLSDLIENKEYKSRTLGGLEIKRDGDLLMIRKEV